MSSRTVNTTETKKTLFTFHTSRCWKAELCVFFFLNMIDDDEWIFGEFGVTDLRVTSSFAKTASARSWVLLLTFWGHLPRTIPATIADKY